MMKSANIEKQNINTHTKKTKTPFTWPKTPIQQLCYLYPNKCKPWPCQTGLHKITTNNLSLLTAWEVCKLKYSAFINRCSMGWQTKKMASNKELVNHCSNIVRNWWTHGYKNELSCLFQHIFPNMIDGLDILEWIKTEQDPNN